MRNYIIGLFTLFLCSKVTYAQEEGSYHPATMAWIKQLSTFPLPKALVPINLFVCAENNNGNWAFMDRLWLLGIDNQTNAGISIVNPSSTALTQVNTPTWTQYLGYHGNGSSSYLKTGYTLNTSSVNFKTTNGCFGVYIHSGGVIAGGYDIGVQVIFALNSSTTSTTTIGYYGSATAQNATIATAVGLNSVVRTGSTIATLFQYKNGSSLSVSGGGTSAALTTQDFYLDVINSSGTPQAGTYSNRTISFVFIGSASVSQSNLNTDVTILKNYLGW